uniref:Uncharacterized protein n=4 Tax=Meloidogyne TaxID=189290 RepID=A0A6V7XRF0_MELEN|nr:unnamed protein product [Meloidogyne enterolobii]CAD2201868.1 unnamed protein product [Meloidogyne enterolobii]
MSEVKRNNKTLSNDEVYITTCSNLFKANSLAATGKSKITIEDYDKVLTDIGFVPKLKFPPASVRFVEK